MEPQEEHTGTPTEKDRGVTVPLTLEQAFGAVKPRKQPEDFKELRELILEERAENILTTLKHE